MRAEIEDEDGHGDRRSDDKWHVGKEIPLALMLMMAMQTLGAIWWMASFSATVTTKLDDLSYQVAALTADKYTKSDAQKDGALYLQKISDLNDRISRVENGRRRHE